MESNPVNEREFARFDVEVRVRFSIVSEESAAEVERKLLDAPSVWNVQGEGELLKLASGAGSGTEGALAGALLDIARQVGRLTHRLLDSSGPMEVGTFTQLAENGARFATHMLLDPGALLDIRMMSDDADVPPVRLLAEVRHVQGGAPARYGLCFRAIHPRDRERLIRYLYEIQRRELRRASVTRRRS